MRKLHLVGWLGLAALLATWCLGQLGTPARVQRRLHESAKSGQLGTAARVHRRLHQSAKSEQASHEHQPSANEHEMKAFKHRMEHQNFTTKPQRSSMRDEIAFMQSLNHQVHQIEEHEVTEEMRDPRSWSWLTWVCGMCLGLCCGVGLVLGVRTSMFTGEGSLMKELDFCCTIPSYLKSYKPIVDEPGGEEYIKKVMRRELRLASFSPLIPLLGVPFATCEDGPPIWVYLLFLPLLLRTKWMEWQVLQRMGKASLSTMLTFSFSLGVLDTLNWFTDIAFPAQAYVCDPKASEHFAASLHNSLLMWPVAPLLLAVRVWGLVILLLLGGALAQQTVASKCSHSRKDLSLVADLVGFGAVAKQMKASDMEVFDADAAREAAARADPKFVITFAQALLQSCLQLWIQASFLGMVFEDLGTSARIKILASLGLSLVCATIKTARYVKATYAAGHSGFARHLAIVGTTCMVVMVVRTTSKISMVVVVRFADCDGGQL